MHVCYFTDCLQTFYFGVSVEIVLYDTVQLLKYIKTIPVQFM